MHTVLLRSLDFSFIFSLVIDYLYFYYYFHNHLDGTKWPFMCSSLSCHGPGSVSAFPRNVTTTRYIALERHCGELIDGCCQPPSRLDSRYRRQGQRVEEDWLWCRSSMSKDRTRRMKEWQTDGDRSRRAHVIESQPEEQASCVRSSVTHTRHTLGGRETLRSFKPAGYLADNCLSANLHWLQ